MEVRIDTAFRDVIKGCARRQETWISEQVVEAYCSLHSMGYAHSVESWRDGSLVGGLYGVALGGAFFGESMFSVETNASKVALVYLVELLRLKNFIVLDVQFMTDHLRGFGATEIQRSAYLRMLARALARETAFRLDTPM
jgi:leucyl/phenylalanyl-tRNA--protein transferase